MARMKSTTTGHLKEGLKVICSRRGNEDYLKSLEMPMSLRVKAESKKKFFPCEYGFFN